MYVKSLTEGYNINSLEMRSATLRKYMQAVNDMFERRGFDIPIDWDDKENEAVGFLNAVKEWENEPTRRTHITPEFLSELVRNAEASKDPDSFPEVILDWAILSRYAGFRLCEYGQETQKKKSYHKHPLKPNHPIMKAFCRNDFVFFDKYGKRVTDLIKNAALVCSVEITWRAQKNRRTGQKIKWTCDTTNRLLCPVLAAISIALRSIRYGCSPNDDPLGFYIKYTKKGKKGSLIFITGNAVSLYLKDCAKRVYPDITKQELGQFSAHMFRVTACVLLQHAGKTADYIKIRLRWQSEAYRCYLRNTDILAEQHVTAVVNGVKTTCDVYAAQPANVPAVAATQVAIDLTSGNYVAFAK